MTKATQHTIRFLFFFFFLAQFASVFGQVDSTKKPLFDTTKPRIPVESLSRLDSPMVRNKRKVDSTWLHHSPKKAAIRSAIIPGWGQIYNKRYWKLPIIYGALGISGSVFVYNLKNYRDFRFTYKAMYEAQPRPDGNGGTIPGDSTNYRLIRPEFLALGINAVRTYRDEFRRNIDYSVLFFVVLWGLNVVDATVDAHLRTFDVTPDLGFRFKFGRSEMAGTTGLSLVLAFK